MLNNKALWGALTGALIAVIWVAFDGEAVLLVVGLGAAGWLFGMIFERPDLPIGFLQRIQDRKSES